MIDRIQLKLDALRSDYATVVGKPFSTFYCPILFRDENAELCEGHIINKVFEDSSGVTTIQRKDVDNFYGSNFESDFIDIQEYKKHLLAEIVVDKKLSKRFSSIVYLEGKPVDTLFTRAKMPANFTRIDLGKVKAKVPFGLKMEPAGVIASKDSRWEVSIERDLRIPMLVSVIKAAHLTLFKMIGYRYALSAAGHFIGYDILGRFFENNAALRKRQVVQNAIPFFRDFATMVRPVIKMPFESKGSIDDGTFLMCVGSSGAVWGFIVFIKTAHLNHGVLLPVFEEAEQSVTYLGFLKNETSTIQVAGCRFNGEGWERDDKTMPLVWPKKGLLYPESGKTV